MGNQVLNAISKLRGGVPLFVDRKNTNKHMLLQEKKSKKRNFTHNGMICGYNQNDKTYCVHSYDIKWIYHKFWTSQRSFYNARVAMESRNQTASLKGSSQKGGDCDAVCFE